MWIAVAIWLPSVVSAVRSFDAVRVALGMVHLHRAEQLLAEPDRVDDQAADVGHRAPHPRVAPHVLDLDDPMLGDRLGPERRGAFRRLAPVRAGRALRDRRASGTPSATR